MYIELNDKNYCTGNFSEENIFINSVEIDELPNEELKSLYVENNELKVDEQKAKKLYEIEFLKEQLLRTDYVVIKIAEGVATKEEYKDAIEERQKIREKIKQITNSL